MNDLKISTISTCPTPFYGSSIIWDSSVVIEYLYEKDSRVWPAELDARSWTQCASAEIPSSSQMLRMYCPMSCGVHVSLKIMPQDLRGNI